MFYGSAFAVTHHAFSSEAGRTDDGNGSHGSTSKYHHKLNQQVGSITHNLNLRQHLARLGRKSLSFSKSVELHDKVIGHYLNIKHYQ